MSEVTLASLESGWEDLTALGLGVPGSWSICSHIEHSAQGRDFDQASCPVPWRRRLLAVCQPVTTFPLWLVSFPVDSVPYLSNIPRAVMDRIWRGGRTGLRRPSTRAKCQSRCSVQTLTGPEGNGWLSRGPGGQQKEEESCS